MTRRKAAPPAAQRPTWHSLATRHRWWLGGGTTILVAILTWTLWPTNTPPPRARQYLDFTACLLTGEQGINEPDATPVWNGLQQASLATRAKVQYLAVTGPQTIDNATTFVATLARTNCNLIFAAGDIPVTSVNQSAPTFPNTRFFVVHGSAAHTNVSTVTGQTPEQLTAAVDQIVTKAVP